MARTAPKCPEHKPNAKRTKAKKKRGKGKSAMAEAKMDHGKWAQKHDPLFRVKGNERHLRMKKMR